MKGALVFLAVFFVLLLATIVYSDMPPGRQICNALNLPTTDYLLAGIDVITFVIAVFNGVVFGIVAWLIYTFAERATKPRSPTRQQVH